MACSPMQPRHGCDCLDVAVRIEGREEAAFLKSHEQYVVRPGLTMGETDFHTHARPLHGVMQTAVYKDEPVKDEARTSAVTAAIRHRAGSASQCNKVRKQQNSTPVRKGEIKQSLFADNRMVCPGDPKASTEKIARTNKRAQ